MRLRMTTKDDVKRFLSSFCAKSKAIGIVFLSRDKNLQTLLDLEITALAREEIINKLTVPDYSEGPIEDTLNKSTSMWVFGKFIKNKEVYIKITMGQDNNCSICISFHIAEHQMNYPFKTETL